MKFRRVRKAILMCTLLGFGGCGFHPVQPVVDVNAIQSAGRVVEAGAASLRAGDLEIAEQHFLLAYQLGKEAEALDGLGCILARKGDARGALSKFHEALEHAPDYSVAYGHIGLVLEQMGRVVEAERYFQTGLVKRPGDVELRYEYAQFLTRNGDKKGGKILLSQVRSMVPKPILFRLNRR